MATRSQTHMHTDTHTHKKKESALKAARADPVDIPVATGETGPDGQLIVTHKCPGLTWNVAGAG